MANDKERLFGEWLTRQFLDLQSKSGRKWTVTEFAEYLDCPQQNVSRWMAGKIPDDANVWRLAAKLGNGIYEVTEVKPLEDQFDRETLSEIGKRHFFAAFGNPDSEEDKAALEGLWSLSLEERAEIVKRAWKERIVAKKRPPSSGASKRRDVSSL